MTICLIVFAFKTNTGYMIKKNGPVFVCFSISGLAIEPVLVF